MNRPHLTTNARDLLLGLIGAAIVMLLAFIGQALAPPAAEASPWREARATWYGPGFYGNTTACGQRYTIRIRGVAVPASGSSGLRCGSKITITRRGRTVHARVIDTGGFSHGFDLSARTAMDLCACWQPYMMTVRWRRGWLRAPIH